MLAGGAAGTLWAFLVVWLPGQGPQPFIPVNLALIYAFLPVGLTLMAMIGVIATRRFFDDGLIDGQPPRSGSAADIDRRVLANTVEQSVLALLLWPFTAMHLGAVTVIALGVSFAIARVAFWIGYRVSPRLRMCGFAATFYPTVFAALWSLWRLVA